MNIQEERQKTAKAEKWVEEAEKKAEEAEKKAQEAIIKSIVSLCRKFGTSREQAISGVMENCELDRETAEEKVNQQWQI